MYEHPYLSQRAAELELEQLQREVERRRFVEEHADQIVRRPEGALMRMLRRLTRGATAPAPARAGSAPCEPAPAR